MVIVIGVRVWQQLLDEFNVMKSEIGIYITIYIVPPTMYTLWPLRDESRVVLQQKLLSMRGRRRLESTASGVGRKTTDLTRRERVDNGQLEAVALRTNSLHAPLLYRP